MWARAPEPSHHLDLPGCAHFLGDHWNPAIAVFAPFYRLFPTRPLRWYARAAPTLAVLVGLVLCTRFPLKDLVNPATYQPNPRAAAAERVLSKIPDGATVETDLGLVAKLTNRTRVFYVGGAAPVVPQFVVIDDLAGWNPPLPDPVRYAESLHPGATYLLVHDEGGYRLMRHVP